MEKFLTQLLAEKNIQINKVVNNTIAKLIDNAKLVEFAKEISRLKNQILQIFDMYREKEDFKEKHLAIDNANAKKEYSFIFDLVEFPNIVIEEIRNLELVGLEFDKDNNRIYGIPSIANTIDLQIVFYNKTDESKSTDIKVIQFIVNPDPKDLWLNKSSDQNAIYAKADEATYKNSFLDKKIVVASKRGRSHAHAGTFRDDDFRVKQLTDGWAVVTVADGAGSAKYARQGSKMATEFIVEQFNNEDVLSELNSSVKAFYAENEINSEKEIKKQDVNYKQIIINILYKRVLNLHNELKTFADQEKIALKELNTTLIFVLCKKFDFGYVVLTFGVGDCPINIITKDFEDVSLLNILDVGEFGGGTRFITMPEIFNNEMGKRFSINKYESFDRLFLMTDGIYDPKFVTESKLEDKEMWKTFLEDLNGKNEDDLKVDFENDEEIDKQLLGWLDFWSKGNHDDRTLAIIY